LSREPLCRPLPFAALPKLGFPVVLAAPWNGVAGRIKETVYKCKEKFLR
jgi:hypothetical protein